MNATYLVKVLTFVLVGFAAGLLYHLTVDYRAASGQEKWLQANDQIVHQLASENQQHSLELERLRQKIQEQDETTQRLRKRNQLINSIQEHQAHPEADPHAMLWTEQVHDARLEAAHRQAEELLKRIHNGHASVHDASEV